MQKKLEHAPRISRVIDVEIHSRRRQGEKCCSLLNEMCLWIGDIASARHVMFQDKPIIRYVACSYVCIASEAAFNKFVTALTKGKYFNCCIINTWPPLWSSGQSFWLQIQRFRVRFPALPDFLSSSGSGTGSNQPREVNWGATWIKKVAAPVQKTEINGRGDPLRWPRDTPLSAKVGTNFADRRRPLCGYSSLAD